MPTHTDKHLLDFCAEEYQKNIKAKACMEFLEARGLASKTLIQTYSLGYCLAKRNPEELLKYRDALRKDLGVFSSNYYSIFSNCVTVPVQDISGVTAYIYGRRSATYRNRQNHVYSLGDFSVPFNIAHIINHEEVILAKSIFEALSLIQSGVKNVTCTYKHFHIPEQMKVMVQRGEVKRLILAIPKEQMPVTLMEELKTLNVEYSLLSFPKAGQDINTLYLKQGEKGVKELLSKPAKIISTPQEMRTIAPVIKSNPIDDIDIPPQDQDLLSYLSSPNLIDRIEQDLTDLGYIGERSNKILAYLVATSRKLKHPISLLIRSQSASGKSFLMDTIAGMMPKEDVLQLSSLTPKALYYMPEHHLKHKLILIDEREGLANAEYPIRSLQTSGKLSTAVTMKNRETGDIETFFIVKHGPISYMDASTDTDAHPENRNRCFEMFLDETMLHTLAIQDMQKLSRTLSGYLRQNNKKTIQQKHQGLQRLLKPVLVIIPFAEQIQFPHRWIRNRRDLERFLCLIEAVTFLHQHQREVKSEQGLEYIEATLEDYRIAYELSQEVLFNSFQELEKPLFDFYMQLQELVKHKSERGGITPEEVTFTRSDIRTKIPLPDHLIKDHMRKLKELEYFHVKNNGNGSRDIYALAKGLTRNTMLEGLTTPEELEDIYTKKRESTQTGSRSSVNAVNPQGSGQDDRNVTKTRMSECANLVSPQGSGQDDRNKPEVRPFPAFLSYDGKGKTSKSLLLKDNRAPAPIFTRPAEAEEDLQKSYNGGTYDG